MIPQQVAKGRRIVHVFYNPIGRGSWGLGEGGVLAAVMLQPLGV